MKHITRGLRKSKQQGLLEVCKSQQQQEIKVISGSDLISSQKGS